MISATHIVMFSMMCIGVTANEADLIMSLTRHFHCGCVFIVTVNGNDSLTDATAIMTLVSVLSQAGIQTVASSQHSPAVTPTCAHRRALGVMRGAGTGMQLHPYLAQVQLSQAVWLIMSVPLNTALHLLVGVYIPLDCIFLVVHTSDTQTVLTEVYHHTPHSALYAHEYITWHEDIPSLPLLQRRSDVQGTTLTVAAMHLPPASVLHQGKMSGLCGTLWQLLKDTMNFSTHIVQPAENTWGVRRTDGTWTGLVGMVVSGQAHVVGSSISSTVSRQQVIDFTTHMYSASFRVFLRQPERIAIEVSVLLAPFSGGLWAVTVVTMVLIAVVLCVVQACTGKPMVLVHQLVSVTSAMFCLQGQPWPAGTWHASWVLVVTYVTGLVLLSVYSAALTSMLSVHRYHLPFNTLKGLLHDSRYHIGTTTSSAAKHMLKGSADPTLQALYTHLQRAPTALGPTTPLEGLRMVCMDEHYAFIGTYEVAIGLLGHMPCTFRVMEGHVYRVAVSMALPKGSPLKALLNYSILRMRDAGLLTHAVQDTWPRSQPVERSVTLSVTFDDVMPFMVLLLIGVVIGLLVLALEVLWPRSSAQM